MNLRKYIRKKGKSYYKIHPNLLGFKNNVPCLDKYVIIIFCKKRIQYFLSDFNIRKKRFFNSVMIYIHIDLTYMEKEGSVHAV